MSDNLAFGLMERRECQLSDVQNMLKFATNKKWRGLVVLFLRPLVLFMLVIDQTLNKFCLKPVAVSFRKFPLSECDSVWWIPNGQASFCRFCERVFQDVQLEGNCLGILAPLLHREHVIMQASVLSGFKFWNCKDIFMLYCSPGHHCQVDCFDAFVLFQEVFLNN